MAEKKTSAETTVKNIRRRTRRKYSAEEKIRIVYGGKSHPDRFCGKSVVVINIPPYPSRRATGPFLSGFILGVGVCWLIP